MSDLSISAAPSSTGAPLFAALDLGTNNCRMLMAAPRAGGLRIVDSFSRIVRLGEGLQHSGCLSDAAMDRAVAALQVCADRLSRHRLRRVRTIATEACRRASNTTAFLARVRSEVGLDIEVVTPREEAELAVESCAPLLCGLGRRALLFDIGGGSTEIAWVRLPTDHAAAPELIGYLSLPVGVMTLADHIGQSGYDDVGFDAMVDDVAGRLHDFDSVHCIGKELRQGGVGLVGTSGTATTLASVALGLARYRKGVVDGVVLSDADSQAAVASLRGLGRDGLAGHPCVGSDRAAVVLPGCAIFSAIRRVWQAPQMVVADRGLREGMLLRLMRAAHGLGAAARVPALARQAGTA